MLVRVRNALTLVPAAVIVGLVIFRLAGPGHELVPKGRSGGGDLSESASNPPIHDRSSLAADGQTKRQENLKSGGVAEMSKALDVLSGYVREDRSPDDYLETLARIYLLLQHGGSVEGVLEVLKTRLADASTPPVARCLMAVVAGMALPAKEKADCLRSHYASDCSELAIGSVVAIALTNPNAASRPEAVELARQAVLWLTFQGFITTRYREKYGGDELVHEFSPARAGPALAYDVGRFTGLISTVSDAQAVADLSQLIEHTSNPALAVLALGLLPPRSDRCGEVCRAVADLALVNGTVLEALRYPAIRKLVEADNEESRKILLALAEDPRFERERPFLIQKLASCNGKDIATALSDAYFKTRSAEVKEATIKALGTEAYAADLLVKISLSEPNVSLRQLSVRELGNLLEGTARRDICEMILRHIPCGDRDLQRACVKTLVQIVGADARTYLNGVRSHLAPDAEKYLDELLGAEK